MTVYAKWTEKEKVTVSFESKYGTAPEAKTVNKGETVDLPDLGTDGDYTFVGWIMKGSEGTDPFIGEYTAKENITFTAVWEAPSTPIIEMVDVTFDMNGHGDSATKQTERGKPITLSMIPPPKAIPSRAGPTTRKASRPSTPRRTQTGTPPCTPSGKRMSTPLPPTQQSPGPVTTRWHSWHPFASVQQP